MAKKQDWTVIERLGDVILKYVEGCIIEIGLGRSTQLLLKLAHDFKRAHYCFDTSERKCLWAQERGAKIFVGKSLDNLGQFPDVPIALGLIDGDHRHEVVRQEINFFLPKLVPGGIIFMHDTYPPEEWVGENGRHCGNVYKTRLELETRNDIQIFTWPYTAMTCGLTMVMRKEPNRPYYRK